MKLNVLIGYITGLYAILVYIILFAKLVLFKQFLIIFLSDIYFYLLIFLFLYNYYKILNLELIILLTESVDNMNLEYIWKIIKLLIPIELAYLFIKNLLNNS